MGAVVSCVRSPPTPTTTPPRHRLALTTNYSVQIQSVFAAIGSCIMAVVNAIAAVCKAIINVRAPLSPNLLGANPKS